VAHADEATRLQTDAALVIARMIAKTIVKTRRQKHPMAALCEKTSSRR